MYSILLSNWMSCVFFFVFFLGGGGGGGAFSICHQHSYECICADLVSTHIYVLRLIVTGSENFD